MFCFSLLLIGHCTALKEVRRLTALLADEYASAPHWDALDKPQWNNLLNKLRPILDSYACSQNLEDMLRNPNSKWQDVTAPMHDEYDEGDELDEDDFDEEKTGEEDNEERDDAWLEEAEDDYYADSTTTRRRGAQTDCEIAPRPKRRCVKDGDRFQMNTDEEDENHVESRTDTDTAEVLNILDDAEDEKDHEDSETFVVCDAEASPLVQKGDETVSDRTKGSSTTLENIDVGAAADASGNDSDQLPDDVDIEGVSDSEDLVEPVGGDFVEEVSHQLDSARLMKSYDFSTDVVVPQSTVNREEGPQVEAAELRNAAEGTTVDPTNDEKLSNSVRDRRSGSEELGNSDEAVVLSMIIVPQKVTETQPGEGKTIDDLSVVTQQKQDCGYWHNFINEVDATEVSIPDTGKNSDSGKTSDNVDDSAAARLVSGALSCGHRDPLENGLVKSPQELDRCASDLEKVWLCERSGSCEVEDLVIHVEDDGQLGCCSDEHSSNGCSSPTVEDIVDISGETSGLSTPTTSPMIACLRKEQEKFLQLQELVGAALIRSSFVHTVSSSSRSSSFSEEENQNTDEEDEKSRSLSSYESCSSSTDEVCRLGGR